MGMLPMCMATNIKSTLIKFSGFIEISLKFLAQPATDRTSCVSRNRIQLAGYIGLYVVLFENVTL